MEKKKGIDGEIYWVHNTESYRRVAGGIAWPGRDPGFVCVEAEDLFENSTKARPYVLLAEGEERALGELLKVTYELQKAWWCDDFYGEANHRPMMDFVYEFTEHPNYSDGIYIQNAPFISEPAAFRYYTDVIYNLLNRRVLTISEDMKLSVYLHELPPDKRTTATVTDYPAIAALGYAVSGLETYKPAPRGPRQEYAESYFNPITWDRDAR